MQRIARAVSAHSKRYGVTLATASINGEPLAPIMTAAEADMKDATGGMGVMDALAAGCLCWDRREGQRDVGSPAHASYEAVLGSLVGVWFARAAGVRDRGDRSDPYQSRPIGALVKPFLQMQLADANSTMSGSRALPLVLSTAERGLSMWGLRARVIDKRLPEPILSTMAGDIFRMRVTTDMNELVRVAAKDGEESTSICLATGAPASMTVPLAPRWALSFDSWFPCLRVAATNIEHTVSSAALAARQFALRAARQDPAVAASMDEAGLFEAGEWGALAVGASFHMLYSGDLQFDTKRNKFNEALREMYGTWEFRAALAATPAMAYGLQRNMWRAAGKLGSAASNDDLFQLAQRQLLLDVQRARDGLRDGLGLGAAADLGGVSTGTGAFASAVGVGEFATEIRAGSRSASQTLGAISPSKLSLLMCTQMWSQSPAPALASARLVGWTAGQRFDTRRASKGGRLFSRLLEEQHSAAGGQTNGFDPLSPRGMVDLLQPQLGQPLPHAGDPALSPLLMEEVAVNTARWVLASPTMAADRDGFVLNFR